MKTLREEIEESLSIEDYYQDTVSQEDIVTYIIENVERNNLLQKNVRLYIIHCFNNGYIDGEDFLHLYSFLNNGGENTENIHFVMKDSDLKKIAKNKRIKIIDMRKALAKLKQHRYSYDWRELEGYIDVPKRNSD